MVRGEENDIVWEIRRRNREGEVEMQVMAAVKELKRGNQRSMRGEEWKEQDESFSKTGSMFPKTPNSVAKLSLNTTTPISPDTQADGRHSSLSPDLTGGHKCHNT
jgi:hypothetical protein